MRDDLLNAYAAVDWAVAQIPVLEQRIATYIGARPYEIRTEPDPNGSGEILLVVYSLGDPDFIINAEAGAIINSIRSALDLLAAALAQRNGVKPTSKMHFPIFKYARDFHRACIDIKRKKWLSKRELAAIKALKPYRRGNRPLYILHQLDITRKHERFIEVRPRPGSVEMPMFIPNTRPIWRYRKKKSVLLRFPVGTAFIATNDNTAIALDIALYEPRLRLNHAPAIWALRDLAGRVRAILDTFNS